MDISRACGQDQMRSCVFLSRSSTRTWGQRWVGGWDLSLSIVAGEPQENLEATAHLTERNAEAWGWTGCPQSYRHSSIPLKTSCRDLLSVLYAVNSSRAGMG